MTERLQNDRTLRDAKSTRDTRSREARPQKSKPRTVKDAPTGWPPRPQGEVFPEVMNTVDVAMLLRYDARTDVTPEKGARMVRLLVRDQGLPTLGRVGRTLLFRKPAVMAWLEGRRKGGGPDGPSDHASDTQSLSSDESTGS